MTLRACVTRDRRDQSLPAPSHSRFAFDRRRRSSARSMVPLVRALTHPPLSELLMKIRSSYRGATFGLRPASIFTRSYTVPFYLLNGAAPACCPRIAHQVHNIGAMSFGLRLNVCPTLGHAKSWLIICRSRTMSVCRSLAGNHGFGSIAES